MALVSETAKRALELHRQGEIAEAIALYRQVLKKQPGHAGVRTNLGQALLTSRDIRGASEMFRSVLKIDRDDLAAMRGLSKAQAELGEHAAVIALWTDACERRPESVDLRIEFAKTLRTLRRIDDAIGMWQEAGQLAPANPESRVEAARLMLRVGRRDEAKAMLEAALALDPNHDEAQVLVARMERQAGATPQARARLQRVMAEGEPRARGRASLELATLLEDAGDAAGAFAAAEQGQASLRSALSPAALDTRPALQVIELCRTRITRDVVAKWKAPAVDGRTDPIFVVGFPRSGTTLIEQMLTAHSAFIVTDELPLLQAVKDATTDRLRMRQQYPDSLNVLGERQVTILRDVYFDMAQRWLGEDALRTRVVDKSPLSTVDLGLVRRIFPQSKVIVALRDPRDTVISCFFQAFTNGLPHLFGFESTAELYAAMMRLWLHYRETLGLAAMEVRYEDLVADPEGKARAMIEFVGETWEPAIARFHESKRRRFVSTPSYDDVAKPVYATSLGRWRKYQTQLERVRVELEPFVREFGYGAW